MCVCWCTSECVVVLYMCRHSSTSWTYFLSCLLAELHIGSPLSIQVTSQTTNKPSIHSTTLPFLHPCNHPNTHTPTPLLWIPTIRIHLKYSVNHLSVSPCVFRSIACRCKAHLNSVQFHGESIFIPVSYSSIANATATAFAIHSDTIDCIAETPVL